MGWFSPYEVVNVSFLPGRNRVKFSVNRVVNMLMYELLAVYLNPPVYFIIRQRPLLLLSCTKRMWRPLTNKPRASSLQWIVVGLDSCCTLTAHWASLYKKWAINYGPRTVQRPSRYGSNTVQWRSRRSRGTVQKWSNDGQETFESWSRDGPETNLIRSRDQQKTIQRPSSKWRPKTVQRPSKYSPKTIQRLTKDWPKIFY